MKLADTSWWVAWSLPGDGRHDDAVALLDHLGPNEQVLTTNLIVVKPGPSYDARMDTPPRSGSSTGLMPSTSRPNSLFIRHLRARGQGMGMAPQTR